MSRFAMRQLTLAMFGIATLGMATIAVPLLTQSRRRGRQRALENRIGIGLVS
jgi:hypothetical protein